MDYSERLERLGKRFPNKSIGIGNPDAKILVEKVTPVIFCCNKLLLNWVLRNAELVF